MDTIFPIGLSGFGKAYDGAPLDPKVYQSEQKKLSDMLAEKAKQEAQKLNQAPAQ